MPRPKSRRRVGFEPETRVFVPDGGPTGDEGEVTLTLDELEAIRLADLQGYQQRTAAERMGVSRATFGRILTRAHAKIARALVQGIGIRIEGGTIQKTRRPHGGARARFAIAVDNEGGVSGHFGRSAFFRLFEQRGDTIESCEDLANPRSLVPPGPEGCESESIASGEVEMVAVLPRRGRDHGWLVELLGSCDAVITRGMGGGAFNALRHAGVRVVFLEQEASPDEAAQLFAAGKL